MEEASERMATEARSTELVPPKFQTDSWTGSISSCPAETYEQVPPGTHQSLGGVTSCLKVSTLESKSHDEWSTLGPRHASVNPVRSPLVTV